MRSATIGTLSLLAGSIGATILAGPAAAPACGGFFCSGQQPVVQAAERVVFEKRADGHVRTWVQIQFQGPPIGFSWVIPVMAVPTAISTANAQTFNQLDQATAPQFNFSNGFSTSGSGGGGGCGGSASRGASPTSFAAGGTRTTSDVTVWSTGRVGSYETAVLEATDAAPMFDWLSANNYTIPDAARPIVQEYVNERQKFVAFRYAPLGFDAGVLDPVMIEYVGDTPCVPVRITAIASTPILDVMILAFGPERAWPRTGYRLVTPDYALVQPDFTTQSFTTYPDQVIQAVVAAGGRAVVTEYADTTAAFAATLGGASLSDDEAERMVRDHRFVTRFYTRLTPEAMTEDPMFVFLPGAPVQNVHNIDIRTASRQGGASDVAQAAVPLFLLAGGWFGLRSIRRRRTPR